MSRQWYFIAPKDVWMFREAKPFTAGQSFVARSVFPPNPQTMQGAIRTHRIEQSDVVWADYGSGRDSSLYAEIGSPGARLGALRIQGPFVARRNKSDNISRLQRSPLDLLKSKTGQTVILQPQVTYDFVTNLPFNDWRPLGAKVDLTDFEATGDWLDDTDLLNYLKQQQPGNPIPSDEVYDYDERVGLALNYDRRTNRQSHLYHAEFVRPQKDIGLLIEINDALFQSDGIMNIGGESRSGIYEAVNYSPPSLGNVSGNLKVVLLTPAYFRGGWQPEDIDWAHWLGPNAKLVSVALGKPVPISGWDVVKGEAKPQYNFMPAGSVYFFENAKPPAIPFTQTPATEPDPDLFGAMGFGAFAVGTWNYI